MSAEAKRASRPERAKKRKSVVELRQKFEPMSPRDANAARGPTSSPRGPRGGA